MPLPCRLGVLAFGDSITNGGGELQWGVALQSWAQWVARGLGLPFTNYAVDGNRAVDVVHAQIPAFLAARATPTLGMSWAASTSASTTSGRSTGTRRPSTATFAARWGSCSGAATAC